MTKVALDKMMIDREQLYEAMTQMEQKMQLYVEDHEVLKKEKKLVTEENAYLVESNQRYLA